MCIKRINSQLSEPGRHKITTKLCGCKTRFSSGGKMFHKVVEQDGFISSQGPHSQALVALAGWIHAKIG